MVSDVHMKGGQENNLFLNILPPATRAAFLFCSQMPLFKTSRWYLAGGTALAVQTGHRQSVDLDFFTPLNAFQETSFERDFVDLYWYFKNRESLSPVIQRAVRQFPGQEHNLNHILRSLTYFADAEDDPMPTLFFKATWSGIKQFFQKEVTKVAREVLGL